MNGGSFILDNYYFVVLFIQVGVLAALMTYLGRFDYRDPRTGAFRRVVIGATLWAFFDFAMDLWSRRLAPGLAFDLYRYICVFFLVYPAAACELTISLYRDMTSRLRAWVYGSYLLLYLLALAAPGMVSAGTFGIPGGYGSLNAPWNLTFKIYTLFIVAALLVRLAVKALADGDPVARREKLVLVTGGAGALGGIVLAQILRTVWPDIPWMGNLFTLSFIIAAFFSLKNYGRVLTSQALYRLTVQATPNGMIHLHQGRITWASPSMRRLLGVEQPGQLTGKELREIVAPGEGGRREAAEILSRGDVSEEEVLLRRPDGVLVPCLAGGAPFNPDDPADGALIVFTDITEFKRIQEEREKLIRSLREALDEVKTLSGFLPICANCKKIRDDEGYWQQIEEYIQDRSQAQFSHSICPDCRRVLYPDLPDHADRKDG